MKSSSAPSSWGINLYYEGSLFLFSSLLKIIKFCVIDHFKTQERKHIFGNKVETCHNSQPFLEVMASGLVLLLHLLSMLQPLAHVTALTNIDF